MALAVRGVGLDPVLLATPSADVLNATLYAYLRGQIPAVLAFHLFELDKSGERCRGAHAVTVTGFSLGAEQPRPLDGNGFLLRAARIDKLYAHDDQIGPFARMVERFADGRFFLETAWGSADKLEARPWFVLLALYPKIRIPFATIHDAVMVVDELLNSVRVQLSPGSERPEWDIYLTTVGALKQELRASAEALPKAALAGSLTASLPRFLWRVIARCAGEPQFEWLLDATGIAQHALLVHTIEYKAEIPELMAALAPHVAEQIRDRQARFIFERYLEK